MANAYGGSKPPHTNFMISVLSMHGRATIIPDSGALVRKKTFLKLVDVINIFMVAVAQLVEHWIVVPVVASSSLVRHPNLIFYNESEYFMLNASKPCRLWVKPKTKD